MSDNMSKSQLMIDGESNLPSLRHPTAWELAGRRRTATLRGQMNDDYGRHHRHHIGLATRDDLLYPRTDHRQQMIEMEDLLQRYRDELESKDQEILQLTSIETPRLSAKVTSTLGSNTDAASYHIRLSNLESKLFEAQREIEAKEQKIRDLQASIDVRSEAEVRTDALIQSLRQKLADHEAAYGSIEGAANRSELTIVTLQQQNNEAQQRIVELESRQRSLNAERDKAEQQALSSQLKLSETLTQINSILLVDGLSSNSNERTLNAVRELVHENSTLRGKLSTLTDHSKNHDVEVNTGRETISRLNGQIDRLNKTINTLTIDMENLRLERDSSSSKQRELEREVELLKGRLETSQEGWSEARKKLEENFCRCDKKSLQRYHCFVEALSRILSDSRIGVEPNEEHIKERLRDLLRIIRDKNEVGKNKMRIGVLEGELADKDHITCCCDDERHRKRLRPGIEQLEERLRRAELDLGVTDSLRDALRAEKAKLARFLEDIARVLNIDCAVLDVSFEGATDAVLRRLEKVMRVEISSRAATEHSDCHTHIHGLQRKVKNLKEQINGKEMDNDVLRKKISSLEDRLAAFERQERDREEEFAKNRRLVKLVEKYKCELNEAHVEIRELKIKLNGCLELQVTTTEKEHEIDRLERQVGQLEHVRERQAMKITDLQQEVLQVDRQDEVVVTRLTILSDEVQTLRQALEESNRREHQLMDLRRVIARMLGIDVIHVPVPDFEIISRLEKLILAQQATGSNMAVSLSLDDIIDELGDEFRSGYQKAGFFLDPPRRQRVQSSPVRAPVSTKPKSPARKLDTKVY